MFPLARVGKQPQLFFMTVPLLDLCSSLVRHLESYLQGPCSSLFWKAEEDC